MLELEIPQAEAGLQEKDHWTPMETQDVNIY